MFVEVPPGEDWNWLRSLHNSYHKWTQSSMYTWLSKATKPNYDPPKSKHVRRLILGTLRDEYETPLSIAKYSLQELEWRSDPRIAAKALYIILLLLQYQEDFKDSSDVVTYTNKIVAYYTDHIPTSEHLQIYSQAATRLGAIINSKITFHQMHLDVQGNFAVKNESICDKKFIEDLRSHLTCTLYETKGVQSLVKNSDDFLITVLWQPMVQETTSVYRLLRNLDDTKDQLSTDTENLIGSLIDFPFISSTVVFPMPGENVTVPRERFPKKI